jgi:hypothetical protein
LLLFAFLLVAIWPDHLAPAAIGFGAAAAAGVPGGLLGQGAYAGLLSHEERVALRDEARAMFDHAYGSYMTHAYPLDELKPLSCAGRDWRKRDRGTLDDPLGGYALTLVDTLDMLAVLGDYDRCVCFVCLCVWISDASGSPITPPHHNPPASGRRCSW